MAKIVLTQPTAKIGGGIDSEACGKPEEPIKEERDAALKNT